MVKKNKDLCFGFISDGGVRKWIDKDLYKEIEALQKRLEKMYNTKISFRAASKIYVYFKNGKKTKY